MDILKNLSDIMGSAKKTLSEKSKKSAAVSRLRSLIKSEEQNCERAYIALGKYYYHTLRDKNDIVTEPYCASLDASREKIEKAAEKLEKYYRDEPEKAEKIKDEINEVVPEAEPTVKAYVYLRDGEEEAEIINDMTEGDQMVDVAAAGQVLPSERKEAPDSEEQDAQYLPFE